MRQYISNLFAVLAIAFLAACTTVPTETVDRRMYVPDPGASWSDPLAEPEPTTLTVDQVVEEGYGAAVEVIYDFRTKRNTRGGVLETKKCELLPKAEGTRISSWTRCEVILVNNQARIKYRDGRTVRVIPIDGPRSPFVCNVYHSPVREYRVGGILDVDVETLYVKWYQRSCSTNGL